MPRGLWGGCACGVLRCEGMMRWEDLNGTNISGNLQLKMTCKTFVSCRKLSSFLLTSGAKEVREKSPYI